MPNKHILAGLVIVLAGCSSAKEGPKQDECPGIGVSGCRGSSRVVCERGDGNYVWADVVECRIGCQDGQCIAGGGSCEDQCQEEGINGCRGDTAVVCALGDGCRVWADVARCSKGCSDGACVGANFCRNECPSEGVRGCRGSEAFLCARTEDCLSWSPIIDCSNGCTDGFCNGGNTCDDQCSGEGTLDCRDDVLIQCIPLDGCLGWVDLRSCSLGCSGGQCNEACNPSCDGRQCGDDGCGGSCGSCEGDASCVDGQCQPGCTPNAWTDCCGSNVCWYNMCGQQGDVTAYCDSGCEGGQCKGCTADCTNRQCGDNGCGGSCGSCTNGASCVDYQCQGGCTPNSWTDCCGSNVCWYNSCGQQGDVTAYCDSGCEGGQCKGCTPNCTNRQCGDNGCGGSCGNCSGGAVCQSNQCVCTSNAWKACCGQNVCWFDSCGNQTGTDSTCPYGCSAGVCNNCTPQCGGKQCGNNGCGGSCGTCGGGQTCTAAGQCQGTTGAKTVTGLLTYDARFPRVNGSQLVLDQVESMPAAGAVVFVIDSAGNLLGMAQADWDGRYSVGLSKALTGGEMVIFSTLWAPSLDDPPVLAVLEPPYGGAPGTRTSPTWAWSSDIPLNGQVGELHVSEAQGSGALYLLLYSMSAMGEVIDFLLAGQATNATTLALLWAPGVAWDCGCCFWSAQPQNVANDGGSFSQAIYIGGGADRSSAWGYPVILHEFGHYLARNYSKDNSPGGPHSYGQLLVPPFAWSEGWASFFSVSTMSRWLGEAAPLMWDIQKSSSFWIDYDAAAASRTGLPVAPNPNGGISQSLDEAWVSTMLWHLWDGYDVAELPGSEDGTALGTGAILNAIMSQRFWYLDRGYTGADFVDFSDSVVCANPSIAMSFETTVRSVLGFPYLVDDAICY